MGWFTVGWFKPGWFADVQLDPTIVTPARMDVYGAIPEAQLKLGQRKLAALQGVVISSPSVNNRTGIIVKAEVCSLNNRLASGLMVKTGSRNQAGSLNAVLASKPNALKTGFKFISISCSIDNKIRNSPLLRTGTKQSIKAFNL